tara:strand:- start:165 stop:356 length:192 start_codon:yes stop_codon:yes gene_type:complete
MEEGGQLKGEFPVNKITNIFGKVSYSDRKKSYGFQLLVVKSNGEPRGIHTHTLLNFLNYQSSM